MSSETGYLIPVSSITLHVNISPCPDKTWRQYDSNKHRLFTYPLHITTNNNKDIVVVDLTSGDTGRVVVVGWEEGLRWTYTGHSKINVTTQFTPNDCQKEKCQLSNINNKT
jgi:uncharacterized secreted protein with C-terminal beta-propeller domain